MRNTGLDEAQAGIKIARQNINNFKYADDITLLAESEELKILLMKMKESEKVGLKLNIQKTKIMASGLITLWQIDGETGETVTDFIFLGSKITADGDCSHEIKRRLLLGRKVMTNLIRSDQIRSVAQSCPTLCDSMNPSMPGLPVHHQLQSSLRLTSIESVMPSSHLILCRPLLLRPPIPPSNRVFSNESTLRMRWPKYWTAY